MKTIYTHSDLNTFFEEFKSLPNSYNIEQVHQLLNNPDAKARHKVNFHSKPLKIILMTSAFLAGITSIFLWQSPGITNMDIASRKQPESQNEIIQKKVSQATDTINNKNILEAEKSNSQKDVSIDTDSSEFIFKSQFQYAKINYDSSSKSDSNEAKSRSCYWPADTIIDKKSLYVYLSASELKNLGVSLEKDSMYYSNTTPDKRYNGSTSTNWHTNKPPETNFNFQMVYSTDTACTRYRWGHKFYTEVDTLVPVVIGIHEDYDKILWFTATPSFFNALPTRYNNLESVFNQLICLKKKNPDHQFVNHWKIENNIVLDEINFLELSVDNLEKLSFQFFEDSLSLVHPSKSMFYNMGKWMSHTGTKCIDSVAFPPNPLPVIVTDEKGLAQNYFGHGAKKDFSNSMFDILVPVKIPLNELISTKDYYLIFWFYPTDEFVNALPENIKYDLKLERNEILESASSSTKSCTYFEVCKSTLQLDNFKLYPNPAIYSATIEFDIAEEVNGSVSIVNIAGAQLKTLVPNSAFMAGHHSFQLDLSGITPGIYLIKINTDKGFKTQRIIISD